MKLDKFTGFLMIVLFCLMAVFAVNAQDTMTNAEVIRMAKAGFSAPVILAKIKSTPGKYDLSLDSMIAMKKEGVSDDVVAAMLEANNRVNGGAAVNPTAGSGSPMNSSDPLAPHGFGIYLFEEREGAMQMTQLSPNVSAQNRTGGMFTSSMTYGIGKVKTKANLPGTAAKLQVKSSKPVFYFYLDTKSGGMNTSSGIPSTPNEFALVKFNVRSDNREVTIAKGNAFGTKGGLSDEYVKAFDVENVAEGVFKITPKDSLPAGEYGFYLINSGSSNANAAVGSKFFDFGINLR